MNNFTGVTVVGLTGQTGAGKSTVSEVFLKNGFAVINADIVSRTVVEKGTKCLDEIADFFGDSVLNDDRSLNRKALGNIVFSDKVKLETLNTIIYPYITGEILRQIKKYADSGTSFILLDAPTLFESRSNDFCDIIISVVAEPDTRKQRIISRDGLTEEQALNRMKSQLDEEFFRSHSDYIIDNNGSVEDVREISKELADKIMNCYHI